MRSDHEVKQDVERALEADSRIGARDIATSVHDGVVTLAGFARSFRERSHAEALVKRVYGVVGLTNDIEVRLCTARSEPGVNSVENRIELVADIRGCEAIGGGSRRDALRGQRRPRRR